MFLPHCFLELKSKKEEKHAFLKDLHLDMFVKEYFDIYYKFVCVRICESHDPYDVAEVQQLNAITEKLFSFSDITFRAWTLKFINQARFQLFANFRFK